MNKTVEFYKTSHVPLAAYLSTQNCEMSEIYVENGRGVFEFRLVPMELINNFNRGMASVEPNRYAMTLSNLTHTAKRMIQEGK